MSKVLSAWATARVHVIDAHEQAVGGVTVSVPAETVVVAGEYPEDMPDVLVRIPVAIDEHGNDRAAEVAQMLVDALQQAAADEVDPDDDTRPPKWVKCARCEGCGQVANSEDAEPWTAWESLPPGSDLAVRLGVVKPVPCPTCEGAGTHPVTKP